MPHLPIRPKPHLSSFRRMANALVQWFEDPYAHFGPIEPPSTPTEDVDDVDEARQETP